MDRCAPAIAAYRELAAAQLAPEVWDYLADGATAAAAGLAGAGPLVPRPLRDLRGGHTRLELFGRAMDHPILLAPVAYQRLFHPDGEVASAMAASAQGATFVISSLASQALEEIAAAARADGGPAPWFQLYWQGDRERTRRLLARALAAQCAAIVFTIDAPIRVASLVLSGSVRAVNLEGGAPPRPAQDSVFEGWMAQAPTWDDLAWLRGQTAPAGVPLLVKGILHPADALRAVAAGCDGVIVSSHGGRVLPGGLTSGAALAPIVAAVAGRVPVLFDSGVRSGGDVFTALAQGATAVLLGRPYAWGLAAAGALGVARVLRILRDELELTMALTGCARLAEIGRPD